MEIKEQLLELINSDYRGQNLRFAIDSLVVLMLEYYSKKEKKKITIMSNNPSVPYDVIFEDGIDNLEGRVIADIKIYRHPHMFFSRFYDTVGRYSMRGIEFDTLLLIIVNDIPDRLLNRIEEEKKNLNFNLEIWDVNKLQELFNQYKDYFEELYSNLDKYFIKNTVNRALNNEDNLIENKEEYLKKIKEEYNNDKLALFLGAGSSYDAGIPGWDTLITNLLIELIEKELSENSIQMDESTKSIVTKELFEQNNSSPLLQTRFVRSGIEENFEESVRKILYKDVKESSDLLTQIVNLCIPNRGKFGIQAIINYNFDDLVEKLLEARKIKYKSIYDEGMIVDQSELGIYHVHGFLPRNGSEYDVPSSPSLVFSEEGYHKLILDSYNWSNIIQINYMMTCTCVFIGLSLTDPNLRRLLEIVANKNIKGDESPRHYAILKRFKFKLQDDKDSVKSFEKTNRTLLELYYQELGLNIIWIDDFKEIPELLKKIKE